MSTYQSLFPEEVRRAECERVCLENPEHLPVVVESVHSNRVHFLAVPRDATVADMEAQARKEFSTQSRKITLLIEGCSLSSRTMVSDVFGACKQKDGFLYVSIMAESSMGISSGCCMPSIPSIFDDIENNPNIMGSL